MLYSVYASYRPRHSCMLLINWNFNSNFYCLLTDGSVYMCVYVYSMFRNINFIKPGTWCTCTCTCTCRLHGVLVSKLHSLFYYEGHLCMCVNVMWCPSNFHKWTLLLGSHGYFVDWWANGWHFIIMYHTSLYHSSLDCGIWETYNVPTNFPAARKYWKMHQVFGEDWRQLCHFSTSR